MKNFVKWFGIIAFAAVIGFSMAACGDASKDNNEDTSDTPSRPRNLKVTNNFGSVTLTWEEPLSTGGSPIIRYEVSYTSEPGSKLNWVTANSSTSHTYLYLPNTGFNYSFYVRAVNANGYGLTAAAVAVNLY